MYARRLLEHLGFQVSDIAETEKEESDFLATISDCTLLIEEKTKVDADEMLKARSEVISSGEVYQAHIPIVPNNRIFGIVRKAADQLDSSSDKPHDFRLVWFTGAGVNAQAQYEQFISTLYGTSNILERGASAYRRCYFFRNSAFFRYAKILDGAIAAHVSGTQLKAKLCLNPLSAKSEALKASPAAKAFGKATIDPTADEKGGVAFMITDGIDRNDEPALLKHLQTKYDTDALMRFDLGYMSGTVAYDTKS